MDFRQPRLCKRIVLKDRRRLWRQLADWPLADARNSKAGLSADSQMKSIELPLLVTGDPRRQWERNS